MLFLIFSQVFPTLNWLFSLFHQFSFKKLHILTTYVNYICTKMLFQSRYFHSIICNACYFLNFFSLLHSYLNDILYIILNNWPFKFVFQSLLYFYAHSNLKRRLYILCRYILTYVFYFIHLILRVNLNLRLNLTVFTIDTRLYT